MKRQAGQWMMEGISPHRLALTLALGIAIGCIPVVGVTTVVCAALALALRLNLPAIQAANYAVMPVQLLLVVPFARFGGWMLAAGPGHAMTAQTLVHSSPLQLAAVLSGYAAQAMVAWLVIAIPAVLLLTLTLTPLLRRLPALAAAEAGD